MLEKYHLDLDFPIKQTLILYHLNSYLGNGEISFSVVDGEPYVKVGADPARPFSINNATVLYYQESGGNNWYQNDYDYTFSESYKAAILIATTSMIQDGAEVYANIEETTKGTVIPLYESHEYGESTSPLTVKFSLHIIINPKAGDVVSFHRLGKAGFTNIIGLL